jgi:hypothetical protein
MTKEKPELKKYTAQQKRDFFRLYSFKLNAENQKERIEIDKDNLSTPQTSSLNMVNEIENIVNEADEYAVTPLMHIVCRGTLPEIKYLVEQGAADVNKKDYGGRTAIYHAIASRESDYGINYTTVILTIVKYLIEHNADVNIITNKGKTLLHASIDICNSELVTLLLKHTKKETINIADAKGNTPLLKAFAKHSYDIEKLLISKGANPNVINNAGETVFSFLSSSNLGAEIALDLITIGVDYALYIGQKNKIALLKEIKEIIRFINNNEEYQQIECTISSRTIKVSYLEQNVLKATLSNLEQGILQKLMEHPVLKVIEQYPQEYRSALSRAIYKEIPNDSLGDAWQKVKNIYLAQEYITARLYDEFIDNAIEFTNGYGTSNMFALAGQGCNYQSEVE